MTKVIVHAGFHKTGTTSLQNFLGQNRNQLAPYFTYYGKADFLHAGANARLYGQRPYYWRLIRFRRSFRRFLNSIPDAPVIILSRETFSGVMPGHRDVRGRTIQNQTDVAITLAREIHAGLIKRFGAATQVEFIYTTRDTESWIRSVYGHLLRSIHLTDDYDAFRAGFPTLAGPDQTTATIARALAPIPVHTARLADYADIPAGPADAILQLAGVPDEATAALKPATRANAGQSLELEQQFLALNRSTQDKVRLKTLKDQMIREAAGTHDNG